MSLICKFGFHNYRIANTEHVGDFTLTTRVCQRCNKTVKDRKNRRNITVTNYGYINGYIYENEGGTELFSNLREVLKAAFEDIELGIEPDKIVKCRPTTTSGMPITYGWVEFFRDEIKEKYDERC